MDLALISIREPLNTLTDAVTIAGEILAKLKVAISTNDADFVVKLIDVYPQTHPKLSA